MNGDETIPTAGDVVAEALASAPTNPQLVNLLRQFLDAAQKGQIVGAAIIGMAPCGDIARGICIPQTSLAHLSLIGAMRLAEDDVKAALVQTSKQMQQPVSGIIRPNQLRT